MARSGAGRSISTAVLVDCWYSANTAFDRALSSISAFPSGGFATPAALAYRARNILIAISADTGNRFQRIKVPS
jgi:hypothetical protein